MRVDSPLRDVVSQVLLSSSVPLSMRQIVNRCPLHYHQVTSVVNALYLGGYVHRVRWGVYEATDALRQSVLSPEGQVIVLKARVVELENVLKKVLGK